jgi:hypothetical protein
MGCSLSRSEWGQDQHAPCGSPRREAVKSKNRQVEPAGLIEFN